jgi:hypothetical protein
MISICSIAVQYSVTQGSSVPRHQCPIGLPAGLVSESPRPTPHPENWLRHRCTSCSFYLPCYLSWCALCYPLQVGQ